MENYNKPTLNKNGSTPFSSGKKPYHQYLSPNFIEPKNMDYVSNERSIHNWDQSAKILQE